jgi:hypothetical protein
LSWGDWARRAGALEGAVLAAWALVHGVTLLFLDGFIPARNDREADRIAGGVIRRQMTGLYRR